MLSSAARRVDLTAKRARFRGWRVGPGPSIMFFMIRTLMLVGVVGLLWVRPAVADCGSDRDCPPGVSCRSGKCATSAGASCGSDRDCGGAACRSGKCANAPDGTCGSDRDCGPGGTCRSGRCAGSR